MAGLAIAVGAATLGVPLIGYLGYNAIKWIANTQLFERMSICFKKYCCCQSKRAEPNIRLEGNPVSPPIRRVPLRIPLPSKTDNPIAPPHSPNPPPVRIRSVPRSLDYSPPSTNIAIAPPDAPNPPPVRTEPLHDSLPRRQIDNPIAPPDAPAQPSVRSEPLHDSLPRTEIVNRVAAPDAPDQSSVRTEPLPRSLEHSPPSSSQRVVRVTYIQPGDYGADTTTLKTEVSKRLLTKNVQLINVSPNDSSIDIRVFLEKYKIRPMGDEVNGIIRGRLPAAVVACEVTWDNTKNARPKDIRLNLSGNAQYFVILFNQRKKNAVHESTPNQGPINSLVDMIEKCAH